MEYNKKEGQVRQEYRNLTSLERRHPNPCISLLSKAVVGSLCCTCSQRYYDATGQGAASTGPRTVAAREVSVLVGSKVVVVAN